MRGAAMTPHGWPILALPATARAPKARAGTPPNALTAVDEQISRIAKY